MSESLSNAEKNVWETLTNFQAQLEATFKDNQVVQDYALLNGFLSFVDSKLTRMVNESLRAQQEAYENAKNGTGSCEIDDRTVPLILRLYWEKICHPIFKWFQAWRKMISPKKPGETPRYVEFRKMNSKLTKFFKSTHKFYYSIMEQVTTKYDCSALMPLKLREELNLKIDESVQQVGLDSDGPFAVLIVMTLHSCLLYLGTTHRYKAVGEKITNKHNLQDSEKAIRYLDLACLFLPSIGEAYLQKGLIYIQTGNFGSAVYQFVRSALARIPSPAARSNFATIVCDRKSRLRQKFDQSLKDIGRQEIERTRIVNKEIIEAYFLVLFGANFAPQSWNVDELEGVSNLASVERILYEKMSTRYIKNVQLIFENLIVALGGFDILIESSKSNEKDLNSQALNLKDLKTNHLKYLNFLFKFISHLLHIIREAWEKNYDDFHYLAMVRVIECWLKSNRAALQYAHRDENFCKSLSLLLNDILKSDKFESGSLPNSNPTRPYFFEEDVLLKECFTVRYALSDFNDREIFASTDSTCKLMGFAPEASKLSAADKNDLRLKAIVCSGRKFLVKNSCGIVWNSQRVLYEFGQQRVKRTIKRREIANPNSRRDKLQSRLPADLETLSLAEVEQQMRGNIQGVKTPDWGYSGSSAPMAPSTFSIRPSSGMTESASLRPANTISSDGSVKLSSSSTTLSSYSPSSDEKSSMEFDVKQEAAKQEPISAKHLEKQHQKHNMEFFPSPPVGIPPYGFPSSGAMPYNGPLVQAAAAGSGPPQAAAPPLVFPNQAITAYGRPAMPPVQAGPVYPGQPMPMYQPNNWMAQPFYQQGSYLYGSHQTQHQMHAQGNNGVLNFTPSENLSPAPHPTSFTPH